MINIKNFFMPLKKSSGKSPPSSALTMLINFLTSSLLSVKFLIENLSVSQ